MGKRPRAQTRRSESNLATPLAIFIVLFVFSLAFAVYFYVTNFQYRERIYGSYARKGRDIGRYEVIERDGGKIIGYIAQLEDKDKELTEYMKENEKLKRVIGMPDPGALGDKLSELESQLEEVYNEEGQATTLVEFIRRLSNEKEALKRRLDKADDDGEKFKQRLEEAEKVSAAASKRLTDQIEELENQLAKKNEENDADRADLRKTISNLQNRIFELNSKREEDRAKHKADLQLAQRELLQVKEALKEVQSKKIGGTVFDIDYADVDGVILNVSEFGKSCTVDIGRKDGAKVGLQFLVYETSPGGKRREKGKIELKKVSPEFSFAGIVTVKSELDPILRDNIVISPIFKRGQPTVFVLEDDIDVVDKRVLEEKIERFGNKVDETVTPQTDFVVIRDVPGEKAAEAAKWAVRVIRMSDISKVLGET